MKLSKAQEAFLRELPTTAAEGYQPASKLVELGLATKEAQKYGSDRYTRTPAGDAWIAKKDAA
ncbi:hypothetical protein CcrColossus_gp306 [Caulobacter phage CcrColossus]|uniref:Uncharacterized protein n=1 Tax=Caulobacter phage CcrColossus TaxID=1211640 RepID=K4JSR4_9CAUD|nr:hypothetical protein CcrColossus_gp306 [Caulobacter phage CcrColossus]AFU88176.1 hypothetical protein CcrColossus_gp306 [Caulobacter phage CcrColossus]